MATRGKMREGDCDVENKGGAIASGGTAQAPSLSADSAAPTAPAAPAVTAPPAVPAATSSSRVFAKSSKSTISAMGLQRSSRIDEPVPSAAALLTECVDTLADLVDVSIARTAPLSTSSAMRSQSSSSPSALRSTSPDLPEDRAKDYTKAAGESDVSHQQYMYYSKALESHSAKKSARSSPARVEGRKANKRQQKRATKPVRRLSIKVGSESRPYGVASPRSSAGADAPSTVGSTASGQAVDKQPRWARPTVAHAVRQASMRAERELREARIRNREAINRGKGNRRWVRPRTAKSMVGIPDPITNKLPSEILVHGATDPAEHNICVSSPVPGVAPLSVALEPAMARWGTEWGLRDKPAVPTGDANSALGVDMSPRKSRTERLSQDSARKGSSLKVSSSSPLFSSPDRPDSKNVDDGIVGSPGGRAGDSQVTAASAAKDATESLAGVSSRGPDHLEIRKSSAPLHHKSVSESTQSRLHRTTSAWVMNQRYLRETNPDITLLQQRELEEAMKVKEAYQAKQAQRVRIAKASAAMAQRYRREKEQNENADSDLEKMIASMPVLFQERVRKQVMKNRKQAARAATAIGGTNGGHLIKGVPQSELKKKAGGTQSPLSLPVPVLTEVYHQGGFDKHIERQREVRRRKAQQEQKFRKFKWAPGHTIAQPFSFDRRDSQSRTSSTASSQRRRLFRPKSRISSYYGSLDLESARHMSQRSPVVAKQMGAKEKKKKKKIVRKKNRGKPISKRSSYTGDTKTDEVKEQSGKTKKKIVKKKMKKNKNLSSVKSRIDSFQSKKMMRLSRAKRVNYVQSRRRVGSTLDNHEHEDGSVSSIGSTKTEPVATFR